MKMNISPKVTIIQDTLEQLFQLFDQTKTRMDIISSSQLLLDIVHYC